VAALFGICAAALALRLALILSGVVAFDSDEAVVGLMARHILQGARPTFFYGQAYMGSLDAWLVAGVFALLGSSVAAIRIVQSALFLAHVALTYALARRWSGDETVALLSALLMALPPVLLTLYTTVSLGGYGEILLLGDLLLWVGWKLASKRKLSAGWWALWGVLAGLGFWTLGLVVVILLPLVAFLLQRHRARAWRGFLVAAAAFVIGSAPWWVYSAQHGWQVWRTLYDPAGALDPMAPILPLRLRALGLALIGLPGLVGLRLPWSAEWLSVLCVPPVIAFYSLAAWRALRAAIQRAWGGAYRLLWGVVACFVAVFVLSRFGSDPTGRYLLPLYTPLALFAAAALAALGRRTRWGATGLAGLLLAFHLWGTWQGAMSAEGLTAQYNPQFQYTNRHDDELIAFLEENGGTRGYTNYWIAFKIAFLSDERVILASALPHKLNMRLTGEHNRYPPYKDQVANAEGVAYVTGNQPELDAVLREGFAARAIAYRERTIGPYQVFYDLSEPIKPAELDARWQ
jgi:4-amino-4-deoxy-L-arabinose transferase-like glycosyltransferase